MEMYVAIGSLILAFIFYTWLTIHNLQQIIKDKEFRLQRRREERKRRKNLFTFPY